MYNILKTIRICVGGEDKDTCADHGCPLYGKLYCVRQLLHDAADELEKRGYELPEEPHE